jgi:riboflavin kinase
VDSKFAFALRKIALLGGLEDYVALSSRELGDTLEMSQQSASKRILELLDENLITRDLGARRQRIKVTSKGRDELKQEYSEYRKIFELADQVTLHGTVTEGMGEGGYYICQPRYIEQIEALMGFVPYEGTLNVLVDKEDLPKLDVVKGSTGHRINGFVQDGRSFGNVIAHTAKIRNVECAIVMPERSHYSNVIEIICQYHLRRTLTLDNGERIDVKIKI